MITAEMNTSVREQRYVDGTGLLFAAGLSLIFWASVAAGWVWLWR
jgi:hypothetical protein